MQEDHHMQATLKSHVVAESDDIVESGGYHYFPSSAVRMEWLRKTEKTDVVIDGEQHPRAAWSYEAPQPKMQQVGGRFGFWEDVKVA
jgi:uncharacterized protein (DUF427 family)